MRPSWKLAWSCRTLDYRAELRAPFDPVRRSDHCLEPQERQRQMSGTAPATTVQELRRRIERLPRVHLAHLPTPLEELGRFSDRLGGPRIYIKRDDCTGLAFGGNKTRHNEFLLGDALAESADMLVWGAGVQSNNCRQTVAACAKLGLDCHLVLSRATHRDEMQGNLLLDYLCGATIEVVDAPIGPELDSVIAERAEHYRARGRRVYNWNRQRVKSGAAVSYALCMAELVEQLQAAAIDAAAIYVCSGGSTGAGLALGKAVLGLECPLWNILPIRWPWDEQADLARIANEAAELLELPLRLAPADIHITDEYVGRDYGIPTKGCMEAIADLARLEGILLDPTYTGKAMAALIDNVRQGWYSSNQAVVFLHSGGTPALFAYRDELLEMIPPAVPPPELE
jgi:1-aminocyclopropane-1-carboxylate deaminase/D-cysteine desulfhydrase-like pyridoxal-dependent ACC family enzyme